MKNNIKVQENNFRVIKDTTMHIIDDKFNVDVYVDFKVQFKFLFWWITIKEFSANGCDIDEVIYQENEALELFEYLIK